MSLPVSISQSEPCRVTFFSPLGLVLVEMVQCLWVRLVDEENIHLIHGFLGPYLAQELSRRLGHLMVFSPMEPDGDYELDLEARDKRLVANCLLQLAHRECPKPVSYTHLTLPTICSV